MVYSIAKNENYNSYEITFDGKPAEQIRDFLKANGYRWHKLRGVWYGYADITDDLRARTGEQSNEQKTGEKTAKQAATTEQNRTPKTLPIKIFYNGVKIDGGALIKIGIWTSGEKITLSAGTLPRGYGFTIENDSDPYTDYFVSDYAEIYPDHPLYKFFKAAALRREAKTKKRQVEADKKYYAKRPQYITESRREIMKEHENRLKEAEEAANAAEVGQPVTADLIAVDDYIEQKKAERERAEQEEREQEERDRLAYLEFCRETVEKALKDFPLVDSDNCVKILWSENSGVNEISEEQTGDGRISMTAADYIFATIDYYMHENRESRPTIGWYDKTKFSIIRDGKIIETARTDLGDGDGGLHRYFIKLAKWSATHDERGREKPEEMDEGTAEFLQWLGEKILEPIAAADEQAEQQATTEEQAPDANAKTVEKQPKKNSREERVAALVKALETAREAAKMYENSEDGGTCNLDSPTLYYKFTKAEADRLGKSAELTKKDIEEAIERAKMRAWKWDCYGSASFVINGYGASGQANRNSRMAEAFSKSLTESGYGSGMFCMAD